MASYVNLPEGFVLDSDIIPQVLARKRAYEDKYSNNALERLRPAVLALQGVHESNLNPIGFMDRGINYIRGRGFETSERLSPIVPETAGERAVNLGANFAMGVPVGRATMGGLAGLKAIANGTSKTSKIAKALLTPRTMSTELAGATGAGAFTGVVNPESTMGKIATGLVGGIGGAGLKSGIKSGVKSTMASPLGQKAGNVFNNFQVNQGAKKLQNMLEHGDGFMDVNFGRISPSRLDEVNSFRNLENVTKIKNGRVVIPKDRVQHLYEERILRNRYSPQEVLDVLKSAIHGKESVVSQGNLPQYQGILNIGENRTNAAIIGRHRDTGQTMVKTGYKKDTRDINKSNFPDVVETAPLGGNKPPSHASSKRSPAVEQSSTLQGVNRNISPIQGNVKRDNLIRALKATVSLVPSSIFPTLALYEMADRLGNGR